MMVNAVDHRSLRNRYMLTGRLRMQTSLHIGGGKVTLSNSDNPLVLTPEGQAYIPGSSFKGSLRSCVERLVPNLPEQAGLSSCGLIKSGAGECERLEKNAMRVCSTQREEEISRLRQQHPTQEKAILEQARMNLCDTCKLFGSPYAAARINVGDLYLANSEWGSIIQRRDGVAIDRDSGRARDHFKYDFEVVPASTIFRLQIVLENATPQDLQLVSIGLSEFTHGFGVVGGQRSRGLGVCLLEDLQVFALELEGVEARVRSTRLRNYLLRREFSTHIEGEVFLSQHIDTIFHALS